MQGALKISIAAVVVAGVAPAAASAQIVDVPSVQVPPVSVPPVPLPAPLPPVSTPQVSTPPVTVPGVRVDAPMPSVPSLPEVQAPLPTSPPPAAPVADAVPSPAGAESAGGTTPSRAPTASSGQAPSGASVAPAGTASAPPARPRAAGVAALGGRRGVLGTSYRSRRRLVRALRACVEGLPARQERLLVIRYGLGDAATHPDGRVAGMLGLTRGEYGTLRRRALRGIVSDARDGGCHDGAAVTTAPVVAFGDGGELRTASLTRAAPRARVAVRGERASGGSGPTGDDGGELATPLALDADEPRGSLLGALMLVGALGLLAVIGVRLLRARVRR
jgi:hypothetical protein